MKETSLCRISDDNLCMQHSSNLTTGSWDREYLSVLDSWDWELSNSVLTWSDLTTGSWETANQSSCGWWWVVMRAKTITAIALAEQSRTELQEQSWSILSNKWGQTYLGWPGLTRCSIIVEDIILLYTLCLFFRSSNNQNKDRYYIDRSMELDPFSQSPQDMTVGS